MYLRSTICADVPGTGIVNEHEYFIHIEQVVVAADFVRSSPRASLSIEFSLGPDCSQALVHNPRSQL